MGSHGESHTAHYFKIWRLLCILLVVSLIGPEIGTLTGLPIITLFAAFGVAFIKAWLVLKHFMHVDVERPFVHYALITGVALVMVFFVGVAPDVMRHDGQNWENVAAKHETARALAEASAHPGHGHESEHGAHHEQEH